MTTTHYSLDIETCSVEPDALVLSVGMVRLNNNRHHDGYLYTNIDQDIQVEAGRRVDLSTMKWWMDQNEAVRREAFNVADSCTPFHLLRQFQKTFAGDEEDFVIWTKGNMDQIVMTNFAKQFGEDKYCNIFPFWVWGDMRDIERITGKKMDKPPEGEAHSAIKDAIAQGEYIQWGLDTLTAGIGRTWR